MSNSINTNYGAQVALQTLNATNKALDTSQNRISTGLRVASAADDSAVYAIAQNLRSQNTALDTVTASLQRGVSTTGVASTAGSAISDLLTQVQSTVLAASDTSLDASSRAAYQQKYQSLTSQISTYIKNASFNGVNLLDGSTANYSALANADGTSTISVSGQNLKLATSATGGSIGSFSTVAGSATPPTLGTYATRVTGASTVNIALDGGTAIAVSLSATGGSAGNGTYTTADLVSAINNTAGLSGVASVDTNGGLKLVSPTNTTVSPVTITGTVNGAAVTAAQLGVGSLTGSAGVLATAFTETGGGGVIQFSGQEAFTTTTNYADLITKIKSSISAVSTALGNIGNASNAFSNHASFVSKLQDSIVTGIGNLVDADVAKESASLNALQTKQQLGVQALSIANSSSSVLLSLFRG